MINHLVLVIVVIIFLIRQITSEEPLSPSEINILSHEVISPLTPQSVWNAFYNISRIPRPSYDEGKPLGNLDQIQKYLESFSDQNKLVHNKDKLGNILIHIPSNINNSIVVVVLQCHMDMVPAKEEGYNYDFMKYPTYLVRESDDWVKAYKTTLGADDGMGCAVMNALAVERNMFSHGDILLLYTVDEETGMRGVKGLGYGSLLYPYLAKAKYYLNLDSEDWGIQTIGSAGGQTSYISTQVRYVPNNFDVTFSLVINGLKGGHSGIDIINEGANSIKQLSCIFNEWDNKKILFSINDINAGEKRNSIPRMAKVDVSFFYQRL